jgi:hypothetical protein
MNTTVPDDVELYFKGYLEVPKCCPPEEAGHEGVPHGMPYQGEGPGMMPGTMPPGGMPPRGPEELSPPMPQQPQLDPSARQTPSRLQKPPVAQGRPAPSPSQPMAEPRSSAGPAPATVKRASPPLPSQDARMGGPGRGDRQDRYAPPEPRSRTNATTVSTGPSFIGPTGYDVD